MAWSRPGFICTVSPSVLAGMSSSGSGGFRLRLRLRRLGPRNRHAHRLLPRLLRLLRRLGILFRPRHRRRRTGSWSQTMLFGRRIVSRREGRRHRAIGRDEHCDREEDRCASRSTRPRRRRLRTLEGTSLGGTKPFSTVRCPASGTTNGVPLFRSFQAIDHFPGIVPRLARPRRCQTAARTGDRLSLLLGCRRATCPPHGHFNR